MVEGSSAAFCLSPAAEPPDSEPFDFASVVCVGADCPGEDDELSEEDPSGEELGGLGEDDSPLDGGDPPPELDPPGRDTLTNDSSEDSPGSETLIDVGLDEDEPGRDILMSEACFALTLADDSPDSDWVFADAPFPRPLGDGSRV